MNSAPNYTLIQLDLASNIHKRDTYIDRELAAYPEQLGSVLLQLDDAARVRLSNIDGIASKIIDRLEIILEHIRVLVVFRVDVVSDHGREGELRAPPKGEGQYVADSLVSKDLIMNLG